MKEIDLKLPLKAVFGTLVMTLTGTAKLQTRLRMPFLPMSKLVMRPKQLQCQTTSSLVITRTENNLGQQTTTFAPSHRLLPKTIHMRSKEIDLQILTEARYLGFYLFTVCISRIRSFFLWILACLSAHEAITPVWSSCVRFIVSPANIHDYSFQPRRGTYSGHCPQEMHQAP
jgi:hypothetical protein